MQISCGLWGFAQAVFIDLGPCVCKASIPGQSNGIAIGQQTPPVASVLVTSCSIAKTDIWETTKVNIPFIGVLVLVLLLVTYFPAVSLTLVNLFYG